MIKRKSNKKDQGTTKKSGSDTKFLSKEQLLTIKNAHLERDAVQKDILGLHNKIQYLERERTICNLQMSDLKGRATMKDKEHKDIIKEIGDRIGVDLKDSVINQESGEITFV